MVFAFSRFLALSYTRAVIPESISITLDLASRYPSA